MKMKVIGIYSGKGGVGKSTTSSLLALAMAKNNHKVALVDLDISTPSMPTIFKNPIVNENLKVFSVGYTRQDHTIILSWKFILKTIEEIAEELMQHNPEICILDMPPTISELHVEVCARFKPSSFILVVQPNELSKEDAIKASKMISSFEIPISGYIQNMAGNMFGTEIKMDSLECLAIVPLMQEIREMGNKGKLSELDPNPLSSTAESIYQKATQVSWERKKIPLYEGPTFEELKEKYEYSSLKLSKRAQAHREFLSFHGLASWKDIVSEIQEQWDKVGGSILHDNFLYWNDTSTIKRMLDGIGEDGSGLFRVIRPPQTEVPIFPGEHGIGNLVSFGEYSTSYYGVPRIRYNTGKEQVVLFPHEVAPTTMKEIRELVELGELVLPKNGETHRYYPTRGVMKQIQNAFGLVRGDWETHYEQMGL
jgi:MinD-like ATPase involved in chromosome partitioning or flagellar assembly